MVRQAEIQGSLAKSSAQTLRPDAAAGVPTVSSFAVANGSWLFVLVLVLNVVVVVVVDGFAWLPQD